MIPAGPNKKRKPSRYSRGTPLPRFLGPPAAPPSTP